MEKQTLKNMKCAVTGAGGFIGSHLVEALLERGASVRALVHYNALGSIGNLEAIQGVIANADHLEIVAGDIRDSRCMRDFIKGAGVVFHLAALIGIPYSYTAPESYADTNIRGTLNVLEACRDCGVARVVHTSTSEAYGTARSVPINECHPLQAQSPYSASKIAADKLAEAYHLSFDLPVATIRPFNTYGPRQSQRAIIPTAMAQALSADCSEIRVGSLEPVRDLTYVTDVARAFCQVVEAPLDVVKGRLYNLGTGLGISVAELIEKIQQIAGCGKPVAVQNERVRPTASEVMELISDPSRIEREVSWKAAVSLEKGLAKTAEWMIGNPRIMRDAAKYVV